MVNTEIPQDYTNSPSSFFGTPQWIINREIRSLDLDSSNAFEGPEKLLEVWFAPSESQLPVSAAPQGLKVVDQGVWKDMLDLVRCKVLSVIESRNVDAYLLSESSMFVFPHKIVLKTCGTTTLLCGLPRILEIAAREAGFVHVKADLPEGISIAATPYRVFYSRKNFLFPNQQKGPHRSWRDEVRYLDKTFIGGSAYMIGKMNGDHWYLYITGPGSILTPPATPEEERIYTKTRLLHAHADVAAQSTTAHSDNENGDETLEILMTDLGGNNARQFFLEHASSIAQENVQRTEQVRKDAIEHLGYLDERQAESQVDSVERGAADDNDVFTQSSSNPAGIDEDLHVDPLSFSEELTTEGHTLGAVVTEHCGLASLYPKSLYPEAHIDSYLFEPCGYSANGIVPIPGDLESTGYWTVHVTPEPQCSYASFETNVPSKHSNRNTIDLVQQVVGIFKPGRFSVTLFETKIETEGFAAKKDKRMESVKGYRRIDRIVHDLEDYELVFRYFEREGWTGGAPRLGERYG